jgi:hypothetical protein
MNKTTAGLSGLIAASLMAAVISIWLTPTVTGINFYTTIGFVGLFFLISLVITLLLGAPLFFLFLYLKIIRWWSALAAGGFVGMLVAIGMRIPNQIHIQDLLTTGAVGALSALCFWFFWRQGK